MKKIGIILLILLVATWAFAETKIDPTRENGFTHIKRIRNYVLFTSPSANYPMSTESKLKTVFLTIQEFKWTEDDTEHLQYPTETIQKKTGDCEDFALYFLTSMRFLGHPIQRLGLALIIKEDDPIAHLTPIFQKESGAWWVWESGAAIGVIFPLAWYLNAVAGLSGAILFMGFRDNSIVITLTKTHLWTETLGTWMKDEEIRVKAKGHATE